ncbi:MAG: domain protein beta Propeller, partial [Paenibacillus sp.]|nr:domain protein beta Propeller [Paenibacillus sp.]
MMLSLLLVALLATGILQGAGASGLDVQHNEQAMIEEILNEGMAEEVPDLPDGVPVLNALPELSRESYVELSGYAEAGSDVMVYYVREGEEEANIGEPVRAEENESGIGRFSLSLEMPDEGSYSFTAASGKDGAWGERSNPVTTRLDWSSPLDPPSVRWELLAYNEILVTWEPAVLEDGTPDPEVESYVIYDETTNEIIAERKETFFQPEGLEAGRLYRYRIASVDTAGNESYGYPVIVGTSPASESKLIELYDRSATGLTHTSVLSGDGSTVIVLDRTYEESMYQGLFAVDTETKIRTLVTEARDGEPIDGAISGFAVSHDGRIVVFASDAANLPASPEERGEHIYAYDRETGTMELLSVPGGAASSPSISGDGRLIAYADNERIYLHDRQKGETRLVSRGADGADENGSSAAPAISGNGGIVAFVSSSTNLDDFADAEDVQAIYVYDAVEDRIVNRHALADAHSSLAVNEDGRYIAYLESDEWGNWPSPYLLDRTTGEKLYLNGQRDEREIAGKAYDRMSISADGSAVLAGLFDYNSELSGMYRFTERFDVNDLSSPVAAGNPAMESIGAAMDAAGDRIAYTRGGDLYMYCAGDCGVAEPEGPIASAYWSVADGSWFQGELKQGSRLSVQAAGEKGQRLQAIVSYKSKTGDESGEPEQIGVELPEMEGASGIYRGGFEITAGIAELLSIEVRTGDGSAAMALDRLPIRIAASLTVNIETDAPEWLEGTRLVLTGPDESIYEAPVTPEKLG